MRSQISLTPIHKVSPLIYSLNVYYTPTRWPYALLYTYLLSWANADPSLLSWRFSAVERELGKQSHLCTNKNNWRKGLGMHTIVQLFSLWIVQNVSDAYQQVCLACRSLPWFIMAPGKMEAVWFFPALAERFWRQIGTSTPLNFIPGCSPTLDEKSQGFVDSPAFLISFSVSGEKWHLTLFRIFCFFPWFLLFVLMP